MGASTLLARNAQRVCLSVLCVYYDAYLLHVMKDMLTNGLLSMVFLLPLPVVVLFVFFFIFSYFSLLLLLFRCRSFSFASFSILLTNNFSACQMENDLNGIPTAKLLPFTVYEASSYRHPLCVCEMLRVYITDDCQRRMEFDARIFVVGKLISIII